MAIVEGVVQHGDARGRQLGFPTANIACQRDGLEGVWAGTVGIDDGRTALATVSIGRRATFHGSTGPCLLEAFLLDFAGDLYGRHLSVHLLHFLRPQHRYETVDLLIGQLHDDVRSTRMWTAENTPAQLGPSADQRTEASLA